MIAKRTMQTVAFSRQWIVPMAILFACLAGMARAADQPAAAPAGATATAEEIRLLVAKLGDNDYKTREAAQKKLIEIGPPARESVEAAGKSTDPEVQQRAQTILGEIGRTVAEQQLNAIRKNILWQLPLDATTLGRPVLAGKMVLLTSNEFAGNARRGGAMTDSKLHAVSAETGKEVWTFAKEAKPLSDAVAAGKHAYVVVENSTVQALDVETGKALWDAKLGDSVQGLCACGGGVFARDETAVHALDAKTGKELWKETLGEANKPSAQSGIGCGEGLVLIQDQAQAVAHDASSGEKKWSCVLDKDALNAAAGPGANPAGGNVPIRGGAGGFGVRGGLQATANTPLIKGGTAYIITSSPTNMAEFTLRALDVKTGKLTWEKAFTVAGKNVRFAARGIVFVNGKPMSLAQPTPVACDGENVAVLRAGLLYVVDAATGTKDWTFDPEAAAETTDPTTGASSAVIQGGAAGRQVAVGAMPLMVTKRGMMQGGSDASPVIRDGVVFFSTFQGLQAVDLKSRKSLWSFVPKDASVSSYVVGDGVAYITTLPGSSTLANNGIVFQGGVVPAGGGNIVVAGGGNAAVTIVANVAVGPNGAPAADASKPSLLALKLKTPEGTK